MQIVMLQFDASSGQKAQAEARPHKTAENGAYLYFSLDEQTLCHVHTWGIIFSSFLIFAPSMLCQQLHVELREN